MLEHVHDGTQDLAAAADALAARVPEPLAGLARLAYDLRWSWFPDGDAVFAAVDPDRWARCGRNPVRLLQEASTASLQRAAADTALHERAARLEDALAADDARETATAGVATGANPVAYFSAEFGVHASLPIYSGGLGALAGDILKEASDLAFPMVAVGLLYRRGYFHQRIDRTGWQQEHWTDSDPERLPAALVTTGGGRPLVVEVPLNGEVAVAQVWRVRVGRVPLFLLDVDRPDNDPLTRWTSARLYDGDPETRLAQYVLLGVGGVRALAAMGIDPAVVHLNEGHAAFAALELTRRERSAGATGHDALEAARAKVAFTTHTPVPAGNDTYPAEQVTRALAGVAGGAGTTADDVLRLGRTHPDDPHEPFGVTQFALRTSSRANGVSARHGEVARDMWQALWPGRPPGEAPIGHVTNGVHVPSWLGGPMRELLDRHLGEGWLTRAADPATWAPVDRIPDAELWAARQAQRAALVGHVRSRSVTDRLARGEGRGYADAAARALDPDALTIGFARRVATYKRLHLLLADPGRSLALLAGDRPIQVLLAGKAHPMDDDGKRVVQALFGLRGGDGVGRRVVFLEDYDLQLAKRMVQGCDVWINVPRPPLEASGTSGMKSAVNGGLQLSVLDGWWCEGYDGANGWALPGEVDHDHGAQDQRDAAELLRKLEEEVVPLFGERGEDGVPAGWVAKVKASLRTLGPEFGATRMLRDYAERIYTAP